MRILHLISSGGMFGAEGIILSLCRELKGKGVPFSVGVFENLPNPHLELLENLKKEGMDVFSFLCRGPIDFRVFFQLRRFIREKNISILHSHNYKSDVYGWMSSFFSGVKFCITSHGFTSENVKVKFYERLDRFTLRRADHVICVSKRLQDENLSRGVQKEKISTINNGIDVDFFTPSKDRSFREKFQIKGDRLLAGVVGRFSPEKGHTFLIKSAREVVRRFPKVLFVFAGEGPLEEEYKKEISTFSLEDHFLFAGLQKDMKRFYASLDFLVMPSLTEGLPLVLLEAMAMEIPAIATTVGDIPHVIDHKRSGILVDQGDEESLAGGLLLLLESRDHWKAWAKEGRETVIRFFSSKRMAEQYLEVYQGLERKGDGGWGKEGRKDEGRGEKRGTKDDRSRWSLG